MDQIYLYVGLVGVALILYALTRTSKEVSAGSAVPQPAVVDDGLKDTLDEFMDELMRDNARLIDSFTQMQIDTKKQLADQGRLIQGLQVRLNELEQQQELRQSIPEAIPVAVSLLAKESEQAPSFDPVPAHAPEHEEAVPALFAHNERYSRVVELSRLGQSMEQIARETGVGMGEIQLVLGLANREVR